MTAFGKVIIPYMNKALTYLDIFKQKHAVKIKTVLYELNWAYPYYPECRHLVTKSRIYRNVILDSHLIIYRIADNRIEILNIIHAASSISRIKQTRKIQIE